MGVGEEWEWEWEWKWEWEWERTLNVLGRIVVALDESSNEPLKGMAPLEGMAAYGSSCGG